MKLFKRDRRTKEQKAIEQYQGLQAQMVTLQREHLILMEQSNHGRDHSEYGRGAHEQATQKRKQIDAVWKKIQVLAPSIPAAQQKVAQREYQRTRPLAQRGYTLYGEGADNLREKSPALQRHGRVQIHEAKKLIEPNARAAIAHQQAEASARNAKGVNWGTPPSRLKTAWHAFRQRLTRRRAA